jgi:hypothetical protein
LKGYSGVRPIAVDATPLDGVSDDVPINPDEDDGLGDEVGRMGDFLESIHI